MTAAQIQTAAEVTRILLEREDPALHGLNPLATPISMENNVTSFDVRLHACKPDGDDVTILVQILGDGTTQWWHRSYPMLEWIPMPLPYAATQIKVTV